MASPVKSSRFKVMTVKKKASVKSIVEENGYDFAKGKVFYQLTKPEVIQDYKEIIARRKSDNVFITGDSVRTILEVPKSSPKKFKLDREALPDFDVFIQSTSHNRVVLVDTELLYETEDTVDTPTPTRGAKRKSAADETSTTTKRGRGRRGAITPDETKDIEDAAKKVDSKKSKAKNTETLKSASNSDATSGGPMEIVFSFDTTGSMYACLTEIRRKIQEVIKRLQKDIPGIRIGVIAHGDYCDKSIYVTKIKDFSTNGKELCTFVNNVQCTGGGDFDECYELVLKEARTEFSWTTGTQRSLVMVGDATPHEPSYALNTENINWQDEAKKLKKMDVHIYSVQALNRPESTAFYREMANLTAGYHLHLDQFSTISDFIMAICYREVGPDQLQVFEEEVKVRGLNRELHRLFDTLAGRSTEFTGDTTRSDGLNPINPSRFQVLTVDEKCSIKDFVQRNSLIFKKGRGFYEFTKPETVSDKKEVVLVDKKTGDMFTGLEACDMIGAGGFGKIKPAVLKQWRVFVQSTSYNRVLMGHTGFLYEVDTDH